MEGGWGVGGGGNSKFMHGRGYDHSYYTVASLPCRDGARRVFTDQADIACTKREAP